MTKKLFTLLLVLMFVFTACGSSNDDKEISQQSESNDVEETIDLSKLEDTGWKKTEQGYELVGLNGGCEYHYTVYVEKDTMYLGLNYDYGNGNENIINMYKDDDIIAPGLASTWYLDINTIIDQSVSNLDYKIVVGGTTVGSGKLTNEEAESIAADYNEN